MERAGEGEGGGVEGRERESPKLLLNQGPSEPICYATVFLQCMTLFEALHGGQQSYSCSGVGTGGSGGSMSRGLRAPGAPE